MRAIPLAVVTAWPSLGIASARIGIGRLPELSALALPAIATAAPRPQPA